MVFNARKKYKYLIKEQHGMYNQIFSVFTLNSGLIDNLNVYTPVGNSVTSSH